MTLAPEFPPEAAPRLRVTAHRVPDADPPYDDGEPPTRLRPDRPLEPFAPACPTAPGSAPGEREPAPTLHLVPPADDGDFEASFDPVRTPRPALEDPRPRAAMLTRALLEAVSGVRPMGQLSRWVSPDVLAVLHSMAANRATQPAATAVRRVLVSEPAAGVAEVTAIVQRGSRAEAWALRLEGLDGRWVVTALQRP